MIPVELIRKRISIYLKELPPCIDEIIRNVIVDLQEAGVTEFELRRLSDMCFVGADRDWMHVDYSTVHDLFNYGHMNLPGRRNTDEMRAEVLIMATCNEIFTTGAAGSYQIGNTTDLENLISKDRQWKRILCFRLSPPKK